MTPEDARQQAQIMAAWANGAKVQFREKSAPPESGWITLTEKPSFNFDRWQYRLSPSSELVDELYVCVSRPESRTTSYAVMPHRVAAVNYPCDEILVVKVIERLKGKESV